MQGTGTRNWDLAGQKLESDSWFLVPAGFLSLASDCLGTLGTLGTSPVPRWSPGPPLWPVLSGPMAAAAAQLSALGADLAAPGRLAQSPSWAMAHGPWLMMRFTGTVALVNVHIAMHVFSLANPLA
jgi:hypothetical protein